MHTLRRVAQISLVSVAILLPVFALGQDNTSTKPAIRKDIRQMHSQELEARKILRTEVRGALETLHEDIRSKREEVEQEVKNLPPKEAKNRLEEFRKESRDERGVARKDIEQKRDEFKAKAAERKDALKEKIGELRAQRVVEYFDRMMRKMDAAIDRLDKLADRIESRLNKIHDAGKDITAFQAALDKARGAIAVAQTVDTDAKTKFSQITASTTPREQFAEVRALVNTAEIKVKEAHASLVDVINSIKQGKLDVEATSTPNINR